MFAKISVSGLNEAEKTAQEILAHIEAIRELQKTASFPGVQIQVDINTEAVSGN